MFSFRPMDNSLFTPTAPLSVSDVNRQVKQLIEADLILENVSVEGELSNVSRAASGHIYFTLKDAKSALKAVMWKTSAYRYQDVFKEGVSVIATGRVGVYEPSGVYQLYTERIESIGSGNRYEEFLRLKDQFEREGLFSSDRKRPIPMFPKTIGLVTSAGGAALHDVLTTLEKRRCMAKVLLSPSAVQGEDAPRELIAAFERLLPYQPDVILIVRGGGSIEDLWAFNDEALNRRIADSPIPVISGVGHEVDFTLIDFVADLRTPTPTAAAVASTPDGEELLQGLDETIERLTDRMDSVLERLEERIETLSIRLNRASPAARTNDAVRELAMLRGRLDRAADNFLTLTANQLGALTTTLHALSPDAVLKRGYAMVKDENDQPVTMGSALRQDQTVALVFRDGVRSARVID